MIDALLGKNKIPLGRLVYFLVPLRLIYTQCMSVWKTDAL